MNLRYKLANWLTRGELETLRCDLNSAQDALTAGRDARALMKSRIANLEADVTFWVTTANKFGRTLVEISGIASSGLAPNGTVKRIGRIATKAIEGIPGYQDRDFLSDTKSRKD